MFVLVDFNMSIECGDRVVFVIQLKLVFILFQIEFVEYRVIQVGNKFIKCIRWCF